MDSETLMPEGHIAAHEADRLPAPDYACPVYDWTENFARYTDSISHLIEQIGIRFRDCGLPLTRLSMILRTLHPQIAVTGYTWNSNTGTLDEFTGDHESQSGESYQRSPVRRIFEGLRASAAACWTRTRHGISRFWTISTPPGSQTI